MLSKLIKIIMAAWVMIFSNLPSVHAVDYIRTYIPDAQKVGEGRLSYFIWDVYDAALYTPKGTIQQSPPMALSLSYLRSIKGKDIADRSIQEMRDLGFNNEIQLADWHAQMKNIFPDVEQGMTLTGVYTNDGATVFYQDGTLVGRINDPEFTRAFFDIWLNENTNAPDLRRRLLGAV